MSHSGIQELSARPQGPSIKLLPSADSVRRTNPAVRVEAVLVFSHLRWDFVFQRPQHLLTRCASGQAVYYMEEPVFDQMDDTAALELRERGKNLWVVVPHLPAGLTEDEVNYELQLLVNQLIRRESLTSFTTWYYTPMALPFTRHLKPASIVYDCMDELSHFKGAHPMLLPLERELFNRADVVFTGGRSLYEHKRALHPNIHAFPSSIEVQHFGRARDGSLDEPDDQRDLSGPRIGFFGVIDERMDLSILEGIATARPDWNLIILGPVVKVDPALLPRLPNIHYLGSKTYQELPAYIKGWDVAILPFAMNDSTRFISPTKTPEYLAAGKPVVSTPIRDVITPYQEEGLVLIASTPEEFTAAIGKQLQVSGTAREVWLEHVDQFLAAGSWDETWSRMNSLVREATQSSQTKSPAASSMPLRQAKRAATPLVR